MSDNKKITGQQDRIRVDSKDPSETEWLHQKFPECSHAGIVEAIKKAGPARKDITRFLQKQLERKGR